MEVLLHVTGQIPAPIVDTQVAAMVCGFGEAVSYENLAAKLRATGEPVTLTIVPGVSHVGLVNGFLSPRFSPVLADSLQFIEATAARGTAP